MNDQQQIALRFAAILWLILMYTQAAAQWETRRGLSISPEISAVECDSLGLQFDLYVTYSNKGPDSLFMFFLVPSEFGLKESEGNAEEPMIPLKVRVHDYEAREHRLIRKLDLQIENISSMYLHGRLPDSVFSYCLPPLQDRQIRYHITVDSLQYMPRRGLKMQILGCTYAFGLAQAIEDFRKWKRHLPTNPYGRRVYAVAVTVPHPRDLAARVTCESVVKQLGEPYIYKQPLDYIERVLREWPGIGPWTLSRVGEAIVLRHRDLGQYTSSLSQAQRKDDPELNSPAHPVEIGIACVKHIAQAQWNRRLQHGDHIPVRIVRLQHAGGEYKRSALDSRLPKIQRMVLRRYKPLPTHMLDPEHDLLVFTSGPYQWASLMSGHPVTRDYEALCQFLRQNFNPIEKRDQVEYLGNVGKQMLGMPLDERSGE